MSRPFRHRLRVRYAECDPQGVVFNAHYVAYFDHSITELWREAYGSYGAMLDAGVDMVVSEVNVRYLAPARFDDELEIAVEVLRLGNTALTTGYAIDRPADGVAVVQGQVRHVFVDPSTGGKRPIPDDIREALAPYRSAEALSGG